MFRRKLFAFFFLALATCAQAAPPPAPKPLLAQIQRLTELLRDGYASWYPDATMIQTLRPPQGEPLTLVIFTLESFGGGNNHRQYLAAFTTEEDRQGKAHYMLLDVIPIGGKGWRSIEQLKARINRSTASGAQLIQLNALEVQGDDAPNFPSKPVTLQLLLEDGRLRERK